MEDLSMTHCMCDECNNYYWVDNNSERKNKCYKCYRKEYMKEYNKNYKLKHNEKLKLQRAEYDKTEIGRKNKLKAKWKNRNVKWDCFETIWERYYNATNCEWCNKSFTDNKKCLEHNHFSGEIRGLVCNSCNMYQSNHDCRFEMVLIQLKSKLK